MKSMLSFFVINIFMSLINIPRMHISGHKTIPTGDSINSFRLVTYLLEELKRVHSSCNFCALCKNKYNHFSKMGWNEMSNYFKFLLQLHEKWCVFLIVMCIGQWKTHTYVNEFQTNQCSKIFLKSFIFKTLLKTVTSPCKKQEHGWHIFLLFLNIGRFYLTWNHQEFFFYPKFKAKTYLAYCCMLARWMSNY